MSNTQQLMLDKAFSAFLAKYKATYFLVDREHRLLYSFNDGIEVLKEPLGQRTTDITQMIVADLQLPLIKTLHRAQREGVPVSYRGLKMEREGRRYNLQLEVTYHESHKLADDFFSIVIQEDETPHQSSVERFEANVIANQKIRSLEYELQQTRENLQAVIEELETTNEELREGAERERTLLKVVEKIRQTLDLEEIFTTTTEKLRGTLKCDRVTLYRFNPDWSGEFVAESCGQEWIKLVNNQQLSIWHDTYLQETQGGRYKQNEILAVEDIEGAGFSDCHRELYAQIQAKSLAIAPIFQGEQLWGLLAAYQNERPRFWKEGEMRLLTQTGIQFGISIAQIDLFTQLQQQTLQLQQAKQAAETANQTKDIFLSHISHELRTPLNSILGFSNILQKKLSSEPEQLHSVNIIKQSGKHLLALINELLDFSKVSAQKLKLEPSAFNLIQFLDEVAEIFQLKAQQKGLTFSVQILPSVPRAVSVDQVRLRQVLFNLLSNAIKFTETGRVIFTVGAREDFPFVETEKIESQEELEVNNNRQIEHSSSRRLRFQVEDTGRGIPDSKLAEIFAPFEQLISNTEQLEGTGLGLTISQKIIQLMGGQIQVESEVSQGSKFWFELELREIEADLLPTSTKPVTATKRKLNVARKILIVDDNDDNRSLLVKYLQSVGFTLESARNGQEGLEIAEIFEPHAILTDLAMPVMNGRELIARIQQHPHLRDTIVIAISANREFILGSSEIDCHDFLSKPVDLSQLLEVLETHLQIDWQLSESTKEAHHPSAIIAPEEQDLISLLEAVELGDMEAIESQINSLESKNSQYVNFVEEVRQLAMSFQQRRLEQFIQNFVRNH